MLDNKLKSTNWNVIVAAVKNIIGNVISGRMGAQTWLAHMHLLSMAQAHTLTWEL